MRRQYADYADVLWHHAQTEGEKTAIYHGEDRLSYASLADNVARFAGLLGTLGLRAGDRFVIALPDGPEFFYAFLGGLRHGAVPVPLGPQLAPATYAYTYRDASAAALITLAGSGAAQAWEQAGPLVCVDAPEFAAALARTPPSPSAAAPADGVHFLAYSSGTTGEPKGIPHRQGDMLVCAERYAGQVLGMNRQDVTLSASKLPFTFGLGNSLMFPLYFGSSVILNPGAPGPAEVFQLLQLITERRPTLFFAVPSVYNLLLRSIEDPASLASLRLCVSAGEALPAWLHQQWRQRTGIEILEGIGSTEALHIYVSNRPGASVPGVTGRPVPGYEVRLVDEDGRRSPSGAPGGMQIRGETLATSYWNRPELNAKSWRGDGWFDTGDVFSERDGAYVYQGRKDDLFKAGGAWVAPVRVEEVLREHPAVLECAVTAGEREGLLVPVAHVVLAPEAADAAGLVPALRAFAQARLPSHMCPAQYVFEPSLPKTPTGKLNRSLLKDRNR